MPLQPLISDPNAPPDPGSLPPMPGGIPQLPSQLRPLVTSQRQQNEEGIQNHISSYENPQKPQGFWQNVRHIAATIGNVAGDIAAPSTMALIPGTQLNKQIQHGQNVRELAGLQNSDREDLNAASENALRGAQTGHLAEETTEMPGEAADKSATAKAEQGNLDSETDERNTNLPHAYAHRVSEVMKAGGDPSTDVMAQSLLKAAEAAAPKPKPVNAEHVNITGPDGKPMMGNFHPDTGIYTDASGKTITNPVPYEKPQSINVNAEDASLDRLSSRLGKPYQAGFDAANAQLDKIDKTTRSIDSGYKGQALALPETLTSLVSGQGTGVRVTMPELSLIGQHNGVKGDVESFFNRISGQGSMTDEDKKQLKGILAEARRHIMLKQQIYKDALDEINGAPGTGSSARAAVSAADARARQKVSDLERFGKFVGMQVRTKDGMVTVQHVHPDGSFD